MPGMAGLNTFVIAAYFQLSSVSPALVWRRMSVVTTTLAEGWHSWMRSRRRTRRLVASLRKAGSPSPVSFVPMWSRITCGSWEKNSGMKS